MSKQKLLYTARHLLHALQQLDDGFLDLPVILAHGKDLSKPNLVQGFVPAPVSVSRAAVEAKQPSLLMLGELVSPGKLNGKSKIQPRKAKSPAAKKKAKPRKANA
jgi:hypothetical protein